MEPFTIVEGAAAPLPAANIDTDVIMPKTFLKGVIRTGLDIGVFHDLRFDAEGRRRPDFILNRAPWAAAAFLIVGPNFGCGSSREHAVWGLGQLGVRALIGTTYAGIFFDNCARNGLLALSLPEDQVKMLSDLASHPASNRLSIDLPRQSITHCDNRIMFAIDPFLKSMLIEGLDPVGATLKRRAAIETFERLHDQAHPWFARSGNAAASCK